MTVSPCLTVMLVTLPSYSDSILFCIFMASSTSTTSPCFTVSPTFTFTSVTVPGRGALMGEPAPAGAAGAAAATGAAASTAGRATGFGASTRFYVETDAVDIDLGHIALYFFYLYVVIDALYFVLIFIHFLDVFISILVSWGFSDPAGSVAASGRGSASSDYTHRSSLSGAS